MKHSTKTKAEGKFHEVKGNLKEIAGKLGNDPELEAEGEVEKIAGKVQGNIGRVEKVIGKWEGGIAEWKSLLWSQDCLLPITTRHQGPKERGRWMRQLSGRCP